MLFSTSDEAESNLMDEIWGCFKYIGIPMETLKTMPTRERKYFIQVHNGEMKKLDKSRNKSNRTEAGINKFAMMEQANMKNAMG